MTIDEHINKAEEDAKRAELQARWGIGTYFMDRTEALEYAKECRQLAEWLKELKQLREQTRWIPVTERPPEDHGRYLISTDDGIVEIVNYGDTNDLPNEIAFHQWDNEEWQCWKPNVTAWMPRPKPYKAEGEKDIVFEDKAENINKVDSEPTTSRFKCKAEQNGWCKQWERECVSWENCGLFSYNFPCPGCVTSSPLEREECDGCKWKDEKQKHYKP